MALNGKFLLNGADIAPLTFPGVGTFMAFSGNGAYKNRGHCGKHPENGPLPTGRYWIVGRGSGGPISKAIAFVKDSYNKYHSGAEFARSEWFALYPNDWNIDDSTWIEGVKREHFRLHPGVLSDGCIDPTLSVESSATGAVRWFSATRRRTPNQPAISRMAISGNEAIGVSSIRV